MSETIETWAAPPKRVKRQTWDDLPERRVLTRRLTSAPPTIQELQRHADRYGSECVVETAVELGYPRSACERLQDGCDRADLALLRKVRENARLDKRPPAESRVTALMGPSEEE